MTIAGLIIQVIEFIWPFKIVEQFEKGCYYIFGRQKWVVGPGLWPVLPWFFTIRTVSVVPGIISTGRKDITLADGRNLSFEASAYAQVVDADKAINSIDQYQETAQEILASVLADKLGDIDPERLSAAKRGRLFSDLKRWVAEEALEWGLEISKVRFTSFVLSVRTYRLLIDQGSSPGSW